MQLESLHSRVLFPTWCPDIWSIAFSASSAVENRTNLHRFAYRKLTLDTRRTAHHWLRVPIAQAGMGLVIEHDLAAADATAAGKELVETLVAHVRR